MSGRRPFLARVREALGSARPEAPRLEREGLAQVLAPVGQDHASLRHAFAENAVALRAGFHVVPDEAAAASLIRTLVVVDGQARVATHRGHLTDRIVATLGLEPLVTDGGYDVEVLATCDVAITGCLALVAQTGSVLVDARHCGGRALTVLAPHHVVVAEAAQLVAGLPQAFEVLRAAHSDDVSAFASFITGPSRTGDIERILVLGAHGPRVLDIVLIDAERV